MTEANLNTARPRARILLVDDEALIRASLSADLAEVGFAVDSAADGFAALEVFRPGYHDLVLTDLLMEGMGGVELLKKLKEESPGQGVIILTGYGSLSSAIEAIRLGADDYLLKPYQFEELQLRIDICLNKIALKRKISLYEEILPICSVCQKIRDDEGKEPGCGSWLKVEEYLERKAGVRASHSYCPECFEDVMKKVR